MRLTEKCNSNLFGYTIDIKSELFVVRKLGQLEDIEDELGIDLITLFKAFTKTLKSLSSLYTNHKKEFNSNDFDETTLLKFLVLMLSKEELG